MNKIFWLMSSLIFSLRSEGVLLKESLCQYRTSQEKKIVIVITSYNNCAWFEHNLNSVFSQKYDNYRVIYLDDCSCDGTPKLVKEYVTHLNQTHRFTLVANTSWESQMANHYKAVFMCDDDEIVIQMDGDDWFADDMVLDLINKIYSYSDIWLTYGQFVSWPQGEVGCSRDIPESIRTANAIREFGFCFSHPRTFYAWLFKKIKLKDLIYKGSFIPTAPTPDVLMMFPMVEMAGAHACFIPDILYCWNRKNSLSQHNLPVRKEMPPAEKWQKYVPLPASDSQISMVRATQKCGLLLWSSDEVQIEHFIEEKLPKISGIDSVAVFIDESRVTKRHNGCTYLDGTHSHTIYDFMVQNQLDYIVLVVNPQADVNNLNLRMCINNMSKTGAPLFFLGIDKYDFIACNEVISYAPFAGATMEYRLVPLENGICAWQCDCAPDLWHFDGLYTFMIVHKDYVHSIDFILKSGNFSTFKKYIQQVMKKPREIALLFEKNR